MSWIESHQALARHRKTLALAAELRTDRHKIIGHLHELWWWGLDNADIRGSIGRASDAVIAEAAGWPLKQASAWVDALKLVGFLDVTEEGLALHDWYEYAGKLNQRRDDNKERMRRKREDRTPPQGPDTNTARAEHVRSTNGARAPATVPNRTVPNLATTHTTRAHAEALVDEFYEAIGVESHGLTRTFRNREVAIATELIDAGAEQGEAREFVAWCRAAPYRPMPNDMRIYESRRPQFLAKLEPVQANNGRNGRPEPVRRITDRTGTEN